MQPWEVGAPGVVQLPSGRRVRGRGVGHPLPEGLEPTFTVHVLDRAPTGAAAPRWASRWVAWPDFGLPTDSGDLRQALVQAWGRAGAERVEVACWGGRGRTGTALACLAVLDGVPAEQAVAWVREHYTPAAVETVEQEAFVARFASRTSQGG